MLKVIGKIILYEPLDDLKITDYLSSADTIVFEVQRNYDLEEIPPLLSAILPDQFDDVTIDYIDALKKVIDVSNWQHLEDALVYKINYDEATKVYDLSASYVRDSIDTSGTLTSIVDGQVIKARFFTPGLEQKVYTEIELPFNEPISFDDGKLLEAVGIFVDAMASGSSFTVETQTVPYRVEFFKPDSEMLKYVIDFNFKNKIIEV